MITMRSDNSQARNTTDRERRNEIQAGDRSVARPRVFEFKLERAGAPVRSALNGSIMAVIASRGSSVISSIVLAVESANISDLERVVKRRRKKRRTPARGDTSRMPITTEVRYADKLLATSALVA